MEWLAPSFPPLTAVRTLRPGRVWLQAIFPPLRAVRTLSPGRRRRCDSDGGRHAGGN